MGKTGETTEAGRSGSDYLGGAISCTSTDGANFWGREISSHIFGGEETLGGAHRVLATIDRENVKEESGQVLEKRGVIEHATGSGDTTVENVH